ncbi:MAG: hypothetical protein K6U11_05335 [bacterium]|nr:hypothetical protein [bacterium]
MGQPDVRSLLVSGPLANVSLCYRNRAYIADRVFPIIDSPSPETRIGRYLKSDWFRDEAAIRAPGTRSARGGYKIDTVAIKATEYAFAKEVTEEDRQLATLPNTPPLQPEQDAIEFCTMKIDLKKERRVAEVVFTSTWSDLPGGEDAQGRWAAGAGNTFIRDVETAIDRIESNTGFRPNALMLSSNTLKELKMETTVLERIKYTQRGIISAELIAALFDLDEVLIGGAIYSGAQEKKDGSDFTAARIWEKNAGKGAAFLFYRPGVPGLKTPSAGYQVRVLYPSGLARSTRVWNEPAENQDVYEVKENVCIIQTGPDLGYLWYNTIAS